MSSDSAEKAREALKREEEYLLEVQKAVEKQIALLKAEQVVLQRQIQHHQGISTTESPDITAVLEPTESSFVQNDKDSNALPDLNLSVDMDTSTYGILDGQQQEEIESEED